MGRYNDDFNKKPKTLKQRINALKNGWDKEADDILSEIGSSYVLAITKEQIYIYDCWKNRYKDSVKFSSVYTFHSQCSKNRAFKNALLWLLDKSGLENNIVGKRYYDPKTNRIFEVREDRGNTIVRGSLCKYYNDAHTTWSGGNTKIKKDYLSKCYEIQDPADMEQLTLGTYPRSWRVKEAKEGDLAEVEIDGVKFEAKLVKKL
jgi:hypothetical protein